MFSTGLTKGIYEDFLRSYQLNRSVLKSTPFVYVDPSNGDCKMLTNLMSSNEIGSEIFAVALSNEGCGVEVLSTEGSF